MSYPAPVHLSVAMLAFLIPVTAYADKGVFNAKVTPHETFIHKATTVCLTAEVGEGNSAVSSVTAYRTTADGKPVGKLGLLHDDGTRGDRTGGDTIFTLQFPVNGKSKSSVYVRVVAAYRGDPGIYSSPVMRIDIYEPLPAGASEQASGILHALEQKYYTTYLPRMDAARAKEQVLQDARNDPGIARAELSGDSVSILFKNGIRGFVMLHGRGGPADSSLPRP